MALFRTSLALVLLLLSPALFAETKPFFGALPPAAPAVDVSLKQSSVDWYKDEVFYHIWVNAFADSDGNGVGDLNGITSRLDYLKDLGVTSLWLSPFWKSPSSHGYDVVDYSTVDPKWGTNDDLKTLLQEAHARGLKVIFDFVPNHVSAQHPWFLDSRDGKNDKRNWFLWKDSPPASGWLDFGGRSAWRAAKGRQYYYAIFWDQMPDLNYREPAVRQALGEVMATWLNFGFDGMRIDAVKYLFEDPNTGANADQPETLAFFRNLRREILDPYAALGYPKFMVVENWTADNENLMAYLSSDGKNNDGAQATLDFPFGTAVTSILNGSGTIEGDLGRQYDNLVQPLQQAGGWAFTFLSNHDNYQSRPATNYASQAQVRLAQTLQMTGWGTPVLYYGNEIGMKGANGNDGNMRKPFPWNEVDAARADPDSLWQWQARLNRLRKEHPALRHGDWQFFTATPDQASIYARTLGNDQLVVVLNLTDEPLDDFAVSLGSTFRGTPVPLVGDLSTFSWDGQNLSVRGLAPFGVRIFQFGTEES